MRIAPTSITQDVKPVGKKYEKEHGSMTAGIASNVPRLLRESWQSVGCRRSEHVLGSDR